MPTRTDHSIPPKKQRRFHFWERRVHVVEADGFEPSCRAAITQGSTSIAAQLFLITEPPTAGCPHYQRSFISRVRRTAVRAR